MGGGGAVANLHGNDQAHVSLAGQVQLMQKFLCWVLCRGRDGAPYKHPSEDTPWIQ